MKKVWKCDFCSHTNVDSKLVFEHENNCSFNIKFKRCWTCKYIYSDYDMYSCEKNVKTHWEHEDVDCSEWKSEDEKLLRKIKLQEILKR